MEENKNKIWVTIFIIILIVSFICTGIYYYFIREESSIEYIKDATANQTKNINSTISILS